MIPFDADIAIFGLFLSGCGITTYENRPNLEIFCIKGCVLQKPFLISMRSRNFRPVPTSGRHGYGYGWVNEFRPFFPKPLRGNPMWETRSVQINVRLPRDMAEQAEEVQRTDPEFLSRVILYGLTRRSIYRHLKGQEAAVSPPEEVSSPPPA